MGAFSSAFNNAFNVVAASASIFRINESYGQRSGVTIGGIPQFREESEQSIEVYDGAIVDRLDDYAYYKSTATGGT